MKHREHSPSARGQARSSSAAPTFRALDTAECEDLLARHHVARIAYSFRDRVDIEPIHYVYDRGSMFGRTSPGSKLTTLAHSHWIAAEVDEASGIFDWRSVVVRGAFYTLSADVPGAESAAWERGFELLRTLIPETGTANDPVSFRTTIFQIRVEEMSGREATPGNR
jgi:nitroimidazol reductase NimA-like FMN-containing flavoprotein (pyridoxamine 5'-phosphate oxidase superfamily)